MRPAALLLAVAAALSAGAAAGRTSAGPGLPWLTARVEAVQVTDDDGGRAVDLTPEAVRGWVAFMNQAYAPARVRFAFDPRRDYDTLRSTLVNNIGMGDGPDWPQAERAADAAAARYPGKVVLLFRHGPGSGSIGGSFSWVTHRFVIMSGITGVGNRFWDVAHEVGHYLGLPHPHGGPEFETAAEAERYFVEHGSNPDVFDGDGIADTPPFPPIKSLYWSNDVPTVTLAGHTFTILRGNVPSYYHFTDPRAERDTLTPQQVARVRWTLETRLANEMGMPTNRRATAPIEAETLRVAEARDCDTQVQQMEGFGPGWSGGAQLFCGARPGGTVTLELPVESAARRRLDLYVSRAPDFGIVRVLVDGRPLGPEIDCWAPVVVPSGAIRLGAVALAAGIHRVQFEVVGKNPASTGTAFGIDCFALE